MRLPHSVSMRVFSLELPEKSLTNFELSTCALELGIPHFRGVLTRDTLPKQPHSAECGIVNLNRSSQPSSHVTIGTRVIEYTLTHTGK